jgi:16S rRNA G527 N7-methylase RsmG
MLGLGLSDELYGRLAEYAYLLADASSRTNLIGPAELPRLWERHILESLAYSRVLEADQVTVDVGSGAGLPGMVLALAGYETVLLEPRRKRFEFLRKALGDLGLAGVKAVRRKLLASGPYPGGTQFVARAVMEPEALVAQLRETCEGPFTCTIRRGPGAPRHGEFTVLDLPSPPLDREGVLVQYRHPDRLTTLREGTR